MTPLWAEWWVWMCVAVIFAILEVVIPVWVFLGFAIGAAAATRANAND